MQNRFTRVLIYSLILHLSGADVILATGETLYARPSADCTNNGDGTAYNCAASAGAPGAFRGLFNLRFSLTNTVGFIDPGDSVKLCGNFLEVDKQQTTTMLNVAIAGANTQTITYSGNCTALGGAATATFNGENTVATGLYTAQRAFFTFEDMDFFGYTSRAGKLYQSAAADRQLVKNITLRNMKFRDTLGATSICLDSRGRNISLYNVTADNCGEEGIYHQGKFFLMDGYRITRVSMSSTVGDGWQISDEVEGSQILHGYVDHRDHDYKYCGIVSAYVDTGTVLVEDFECDRLSTDTVGSGLLIYSLTGMTITAQRLNITGGVNSVQVFNQQGTVNIQAGRFVMPSQNGVLLGGTDAGTTTVRNVTIVQPGIYGFSNTNDPATVSFTDSIVTGPCTAAVSRRTTDTEARNDLFGCTTAVLVNGSGGSTGTGTITTDPQFLNAAAGHYAPGPSSPVRGAGNAWGGPYDYRGRVTFGTPHMGGLQLSSPDDVSGRFQ